ncbi:MAG: hypothetical protein ACREYF_07010 [Gammaproteobacteria bacterium]
MPDWFDKPSNVRRLLRVFYLVCAALLGVDWLYHRHAVHPWEGMPGFFSFFGFMACVVLVLLAKELRKLLMREEDFYEGDD